MTPEQNADDGEGLKARIVSLSDGIFAFAMTLLVLGLEVPVLPSSDDPDQLLRALLDLLPNLQSYIISFLVLGAYWVGHHRLFRYIKRADVGLAWLSIVYLMCIALMPLPTAVLGSYGGEQVAVVFYAGTLALAGMITWALWKYATNGCRLVEPDFDQRLIVYNSLIILLSAVVFVVSIGISFWSPNLAKWSWLLTAVVHPFADRIYGPGNNS